MFTEIAKTKLEDIGINLLDLRFKRINYNQSVAPQIYEQMISERQQDCRTLPFRRSRRSGSDDG